MVTRIQKIIKYKKLSASGFADQIGVPRSTISHILSGRNNPSLDLVQKILDTFSDIKTEWLVRGEGQMIYSQNTLFSDTDFNSDESIHRPVASQTAQSVSFSAGNQDSQQKEEASIPSAAAHISASTGQRSSRIVSEDDKSAPENRKTHSDTRVFLLYGNGTYREYLPAGDAV